jgi:hypothetical protein
MMDEIGNPFEGIFSPQPFDSQTPISQVQSRQSQALQTPPVHFLPTESTASTPHGPFATPSGNTRARKQDRSSRPKLALLHREEWDKDKTYDEDPPTCLHYSIEWTVIVNKTDKWKDTEPDIVLEPAAYWQDFLKFRVERLLEQKLGWSHTARIEDINVVVSVTARLERDFTKRFETEIDWPMIEKRLVQWGTFQDGKTLRIVITFNYVENARHSTAGPSKGGGKRGPSSATKRMLTNLATESNAERESTGQAPVWTEVYRVMRCPGPPCQLGLHYWRDPDGKKHYKLYPHHLRALVKHVEGGGKLECQADVPEGIQRQLKEEERQRIDRKQNKAVATPLGVTPITINNNFPEHSRPKSVPMSRDESNDSTNTSLTSLARTPLDIPGCLDTAVVEYSEWLKSLVHQPAYKAQVDKACEVVLANGFDLNQVHGDQDYQFLVDEKVNKGTARRFVDGIPEWVKRRKCE